MERTDLINYTREELEDLFLDLINEMEKTGTKSMEEWNKDSCSITMFASGGALLSRAMRTKAIVGLKNQMVAINKE
jgi:hypothetical protein